MLNYITCYNNIVYYSMWSHIRLCHIVLCYRLYNITWHSIALHDLIVLHILFYWMRDHILWILPNPSLLPAAPYLPPSSIMALPWHPRPGRKNITAHLKNNMWPKAIYGSCHATESIWRITKTIYGPRTIFYGAPTNPRLLVEESFC